MGWNLSLHIYMILRSGQYCSNVLTLLLSPPVSTLSSFFILSSSSFSLNPSVHYLNITLSNTLNSLVPFSLKHFAFHLSDKSPTLDECICMPFLGLQKNSLALPQKSHLSGKIAANTLDLYKFANFSMFTW